VDVLGHGLPDGKLADLALTGPDARRTNSGGIFFFGFCAKLWTFVGP
jgi:hypothetical protein